MEAVGIIFGFNPKSLYLSVMIIYMTTNLINGRKYIGLDSKNNPKYLGSGKALKLAIAKYGKENFNKEILCYCGSMEELLEKEKYYIKEYDAVNSKKFYNIAEGGGVVITRPIYQYDLSGKLLNFWASISEAEAETGFNNSKITATAQGKYGRRTAYGYVWRYYGDSFDKYPVTPQINITDAQKIALSKRQKGKNNVMANRTGKNHPKSRAIDQFTLNGEFIRTWDSATEATKTLSVNNILACCRGTRNKAGGFIWKYNNDIVRSSEKSEKTDDQKSTDQ